MSETYRPSNNHRHFDPRPDPDEILARLKAEESQAERGKLKIFLGYVAGVGKTYAMLEAGHQRCEQGIDVVVGYIETHRRKETEILVAGLEVIPRSTVEYHGSHLTEMNLDAILTRHPQIVLVDELAHTNAPGSRHPKRYQDIEEILNAGIDVYTTINIQHLESLNDVVAQITGVIVRETVPDRLLDEANEIELIDLPTNELLQRLREGKVYVPDQAAHALEKFFRQGNLTALRELAMRRAASRVESQMLNYMHTRSIPGPWPAGDRILVCISSHPLGERLVRAGRRLADDLRAEWYVMFVETLGHMKMSAENRARVERNLRLAEELGGKVVRVTCENIAAAVIEFAHAQNITKIIAGKPLRPRWFEVLRGTVVDQIIRNSGKIDVYVVNESPDTAEKTVHKVVTSDQLTTMRPHFPLGRYFLSLLLVVMVTILGLPLRVYLDPSNLVMLYLAVVVIAAVFLGRGPSIMASFVSVLVFDYFFVDPRLTFSVNDSQYILTFIGLLLVGLIISNSAALLRDQMDALRRREQQTQALNNLSRELTAAITLDQVLETVVRNTTAMFQRETVILLQENEHLSVKYSTPGFSISESEIAVAEWAFKNGKAAGRGTDTVPAADIRLYPLTTANDVVGVLGTKPFHPHNILSNDQNTLMEGVASLAAIAIERASFAEKAAQSEMLQKTEKLQTALLNSISHELRTPLATITGVLTTLTETNRAEPARRLDLQTSLELLDSATHQSQRLNRLVENLLDMTRLEAGALRLNREPVDVQDLIGSVLSQLPNEACTYPIQTLISPDLPLVSMDAVLIAQVLNNLLDNAIKYTPSCERIVISAHMKEDELVIAVSDHGVGIPPQDIERVFDKFYRVKNQGAVAGTGLGLSICKGIVEAHGGRIWAKNNSDQGITVTFSIPIAPEMNKR